MKTRNIEVILVSVLFVCFFSFCLSFIYTQNHSNEYFTFSSEDEDLISFNEDETTNPQLTELLQK